MGRPDAGGNQSRQIDQAGLSSRKPPLDAVMGLQRELAGWVAVPQRVLSSMDGPRLARASWNVATLRAGCCHLFGLFMQSAGMLALMRSADRHPITLSSCSARCCTRVLPIPVRPVMPSRRQVPSQTEGERGGPGQGADRAELLILFFLLTTSLFDRRDHLFVPTCLYQERRAQRTARLARQGHRRRRLGLAGASTVLFCRWSGSPVPRAPSSLPHVVAGSAVTAGLR
jgi:hypothetical protein